MPSSKDLTIGNTKLDWKEVIPNLEVWPPFPSGSQNYPLTASQTSSVNWNQLKVAQAKPVIPEQINQLLSDTADYFEQGAGWCQEAIANNSNQVCLVGALLRAETGDPNEVYQPTQPYRHPLTTAAVKKLSEYLLTQKVKMPRSRDPDSDPYFDHVSDWNDDSNRTKSEIINTLRQSLED